jgi:hypothetical protein
MLVQAEVKPMALEAEQLVSQQRTHFGQSRRVAGKDELVAVVR